MNNPFHITIKELNYNEAPTIFNRFSMIDSIKDFTMDIQSGRIYGVIGGLGLGGWLLSYLLAGKGMDYKSSSSITMNQKSISSSDMRNISCYIGEGVAEYPYGKKYFCPFLKKRITVKDQINQGIKTSNNKYSVQQICELFELSVRADRPLEANGIEVWRASIAIGFAFQKALFCAPWLEAQWFPYLLNAYNKRFFSILKAHGSAVLLPVSHEKYVQDIADEIVYLKDHFIGYC
ncbi:hypothetical protein [Cohnella hashimotonis]|uniref:Uncharacterized protein n=1 Tax=Cohnella hashimotonis TaxID=2826895 RepID=A0ABT6TG96_9BACL|nr:hypothetical protein [Cohnella hashimotonis]MDI4645862.1 hypothetical protein [Cohnella hashimotonis]